jgi:hypothetical protein
MLGAVVVRPMPDGPFVVRLYPDFPVARARCSGAPEGIFETTAALKVLLGLGALLLCVPVTLPGIPTFYGAPSINSLRPAGCSDVMNAADSANPANINFRMLFSSSFTGYPLFIFRVVDAPAG